MNAVAEASLLQSGGASICKKGLEALLEQINRRYFKERIRATILWEVPKGTVSMYVGERGVSPQPGSLLEKTFETATTLLRDSRFEQAIPHLLDCAEQNHPESKLLLSHLFKRLGDIRWQDYAAQYNRHKETVRAVPAACYYQNEKTIAIHPHLNHLPTPQFVLKYLIYHECCHQLIQPKDHMAHSREFLRWEDRAPARIRALDWLEQRGFPTLRTAQPT